MLNFYTSVSGEQIASELCNDIEELAYCLMKIANNLSNDDVLELRNKLKDINGCASVRKLGVILNNMQGD